MSAPLHSSERWPLTTCVPACADINTETDESSWTAPAEGVRLRQAPGDDRAGPVHAVEEEAASAAYDSHWGTALPRLAAPQTAQAAACMARPSHACVLDGKYKN